MKGSFVSLLVSIVSGIPFIIAASDTEYYEYKSSIAYYPSEFYTIGLAMVVLVSVPSSSLALLFALIERKKGGAMAGLLVTLSLVVLLIGTIILIKKVLPLFLS